MRVNQTKLPRFYAVFLTRKNGTFNCRRPVLLIVVHQALIFRNETVGSVLSAISPVH